MADEKQLEILREGVEVWNKWRKLNPKVKIDLSHTDLSAMDFRHANLSDADLSECNFRKTRLNDSNLSGARLYSATLEKASLQKANLYEANLDHADLAGANLEEADFLMASASHALFSSVYARKARFAGAIIRNTQLSRSDFRDTDLREAEFNGSDLRFVQLDGAILWTTHFDEADLRGASGMRFDETVISNTKFSPRSQDRWSTLVRYYTGPRFIITLVFLIAFTLPYFAKTTGWVTAARTQEVIGAALLDVEVQITKLEESTSPNPTIASDVVRSLQKKIPGKDSNNWRSAKVWELLLGVDKGIWYFLTTCVLLLYNFLRGILTMVVGPMRYAEERSGVSPPHRIQGKSFREKLLKWIQGGWSESYAWLWLPHKVVSTLFVFAVATFVLHAVDWLTLDVWLPI